MADGAPQRDRADGRGEAPAPASVAPTELASGAGAGAGAPSPERLAAGTKAGEYELVRHIGSGAMGDVYEARHPLIGKRVAVKVIKRALSASGEGAERFLREARAAAQVDHPNVVDVFAFGRLTDGRLYLVMDLLEGQSLGARLRTGGPLPLDGLLDVLAPICEALHAAHRQGVVHRDLKPDNVFLCRSETGPPRVVVLDFGIAKMLSDAVATAAGGSGAAALTGEGLWVGTPAYMAPEQWTADGASPRSDLYALGVMTFEMVAGKLPFQAGSVAQLMEQHFRAELPPLESAAGAVPAALEEAVARALAKAPEERYADALELCAAVRAGLGDSDTRQGRAGFAGSTVRASRRPGRPRSAIAFALGALLAVAGLVALWAARGGRRQERQAATPTPPPAADVTVAITSRPSGAQVLRDGHALGVTPTTFESPVGRTIEVTLSKPGYRAHAGSVTAARGALLDVELEPVVAFQGVWKLPDGKLRAFERRGERVVGYKLADPAGDRAFLGFFEFTPSDGDHVTFAAADEHVDPRAPQEANCHIPLQAEYRYQLADDYLELHREEVDYDFAGGRCVNVRKRWGETQAVARVAFADGTTHAVSRAGSANLAVGKDEEQAATPRKAADSQQQARPRTKPPVVAPPAKPVANNVGDNVGNVGGPASPPPNAQPQQAPMQPQPPPTQVPTQGERRDSTDGPGPMQQQGIDPSPRRDLD